MYAALAPGSHTSFKGKGGKEARRQTCSSNESSKTSSSSGMLASKACLLALRTRPFLFEALLSGSSGSSSCSRPHAGCRQCGERSGGEGEVGQGSSDHKTSGAGQGRAKGNEEAVQQR